MSLNFDISAFEKNKVRVLHDTKNSAFVEYFLAKGINIKLEGGSRSGKTFGIAIALCKWVRDNTGYTITIARDTRENLKNSAYATFKTVWTLMGLPTKHFTKNISDIQYNDNLIRFVGVNDDPDKALGAEQDILWGNEWITANRSVSDQMEQRTSYCVIFDYNPSEVSHWLYDLDYSQYWRSLKTTLLDNPYVPEKHKRKILSYEPTAENILANCANKYMWEVYGLGNRAVGEDSIFKDFKLYTDEPTECDWELLGGDFGYTTDPSVLLWVKKKGDELYIRQVFYEHGFLNADIARKIKAEGLENERSIWDSQPPQNVVELRLLDVDAVKAKKGWVFVRLEKMKQFKLFIHVDSLETQDEFRSAKWMKDKEGNYKRNSYGHFIMKEEHPKKDHCLDAIGYALSYFYDMTGL